MLELLAEMVTAYNSGLPKQKTEDLSGAVATAYAKSLKRHHGFIAKQAFKVESLKGGQKASKARQIGKKLF